MTALAIHSSRTITPEGMKDACVLVKAGKIIGIVDQLPESNDFAVIDAGNNILMAGIIDPHVHINEPGRTTWEGFDTATKAAIAGGVTAMVDMPLNASPVTTTVNALKEKLAATTGKLHTNVGFWGGIIPGNEQEIEGLIDNGVLGFKAFLTHSGIDEFPNVTEADLRKVMPVIARHDLPLLVHCELADDHSHSNMDHRSYRNYVASRPKRWEDNAIALMIRLCEEFNCRTHIVHLSSADSIPQIAHAKQKGLPLTVETAQHYLYFNAEDIPDAKCEFKCAPPIRDKENNEKLWQALRDGIIDFVATDHSPAPPDIKQLDSGDLTLAWGGIASIQFALPVLWTAARKRGCSVTDMAKWLCCNPANLMQSATGKKPQKGEIRVGYDADLVIWNDQKNFTVTKEIIQHRHKATPYLGEELYGVVQQTFLGGKSIYHDGKLLHLNEGKIILNE